MVKHASIYELVTTLTYDTNMEEKRPIDRKRESSGHTDIGSEEDGAIIEMKNIVLIMKLILVGCP